MDSLLLFADNTYWIAVITILVLVGLVIFLFFIDRKEK
jgi:hypothetical protein